MRTLGVFAKFWSKGKVKTRLAKSIGEEAAARIYLQFLIATLELSRAVDCQRILAFSPADKAVQFSSLESAMDHQLIPQVSGDLGARMQDFFDRRFHSGSVDARASASDHKVLLIGSDTPNLQPQLIEVAFESLENNDVVIGPSPDGGYYLIGARNKTPNIFDDMTWSSESVFAATLSRLQMNGDRFAVLEPFNDVDEIADLQTLIADLQNNRDDLDCRLLTLLEEVLVILDAECLPDELPSRPKPPPLKGEG